MGYASNTPSRRTRTAGYSVAHGHRTSSRIKETLDSRGKAVLGSDLVVAPDPNPFMAISTLLDRPAPYKSITVEDALLTLTINGAWAMGREDEAGSIRVGKYADFVVLDRHLFDIPASEVMDTKVLQTVFEGKVVYPPQPR